MIFQMIRIEQQKLFQRRLFWIELTVLAIAIFLMFGGIFFAKSQFEAGNANNGEGLVIEAESVHEIEEQLLWPSGFINSFAVANQLGMFLLIILIGAMVAQEYTWRTISLWLSRGVPRPLFLLAKFTAVFIATLCFVGMAVFLGMLISGGFSLAIEGELPFTSINWVMVGVNVLSTTFSLLPYAAITFFIASVTRSAIASIGGGLAYVTLVEPLLIQLLPILGERWETAVQYLPGSASRPFGLLLTQIHADTAPLDIPEPFLSLETAVFVTLLYIATFTAASLHFFQKQDLGG